MINWKGVAYRLNYSSEKHMWDVLYTEKKIPVSKLADQFGVSHTAIRESLKRCGVERRSRGGPNRKASKKWPSNEELLFRVDLDGIPTVANQIGLHYSTVYKRVKRLLKEKENGPEHTDPKPGESGTSEGTSTEGDS